MLQAVALVRPDNVNKLLLHKAERRSQNVILIFFNAKYKFITKSWINFSAIKIKFVFEYLFVLWRYTEMFFIYWMTDIFEVKSKRIINKY